MQQGSAREVQRHAALLRQHLPTWYVFAGIFWLAPFTREDLGSVDGQLSERLDATWQLSPHLDSFPSMLPLRSDCCLSRSQGPPSYKGPAKICEQTHQVGISCSSSTACLCNSLGAAA